MTLSITSGVIEISDFTDELIMIFELIFVSISNGVGPNTDRVFKPVPRLRGGANIEGR